MKTFTIHKYTDLMQDVYSSLDFEIFPLSSLFLTTFLFCFVFCFFLYIYIMKSFSKGYLCHSESRALSWSAAEC